MPHLKPHCSLDVLHPFLLQAFSSQDFPTNFPMDIGWYCWWLKSCTSWWVVFPIIYRVSYIPGGAGFQPSTVWNVLELFSGWSPAMNQLCIPPHSLVVYLLAIQSSIFKPTWPSPAQNNQPFKWGLPMYISVYSDRQKWPKPPVLPIRESPGEVNKVTLTAFVPAVVEVVATTTTTTSSSSNSVINTNQRMVIGMNDMDLCWGWPVDP